MKKINQSILIVALIALSISANAQRVGIEVGYVNSSENTETGSDAVNGFQVGPMAEINLQGNLNLQYGLLYTYLKDSYSPDYGLYDTYTGHFLDVPIRLKADFPVTNNFSFFAFGGPNFQLGLAQNTEEVTEFDNGDVLVENFNRYENDYDDNGEPDLNRFNLQFGVGGGIQFQNIQLKLGYDWGLLDLDKTRDVTLKSNKMTASIGFQF